MIATQIKKLLKPQTRRHPGIGIMGPNQKNNGMQGNKTIEQHGQRQRATAGQQQYSYDNHRKSFQKPDKPVKGSNGRPDKNQHHRCTQKNKLPTFHIHVPAIQESLNFQEIFSLP